MDELRVIVIGCGSMGRTHLETLRSRPGVRVVGVVRTSPTPIDDLPVFTTLRAALTTLKPDLAVVSTPHHLHYEQARTCLEHGAHVLVEKPLTLHHAESLELAELARAHGRYLVIGLQRRYEGLARLFRAAVAAGEIGPVRFVHGLFSHRFALGRLQGWRTSTAEAGAGILDDSALHLLDLLVYFGGGRVRTVEARLMEGAGSPVPHSFACILEMDSGATIAGSGSYLAPAATVQEEISIYGESGSLFARRFCREWNTQPPAVFFKSADGTVARDHDMTAHPCGRPLPLLALLDVLQERAGPETLHTEATRVLESHRAAEMIRNAAREPSRFR